MQQPYDQYNRVKEVINLYKSDPRSFNDEDLDELQQLADHVGIKFSPVRDESSMGSIMKNAVNGFIEGLTTIPVGEKPKSTYDAISHSLGHLIGFAPMIMSGPLGLGARGAKKLGLKSTQWALEKGVKGAQILDKVAVPMVASRFTKGALERGIQRAGLESMEFFQRGARGRGILEEAVGLGAASAVSNVWKGPDAMVDGLIGGSIAGGAFGGIGNFVSISNRLKYGTPTQRKNAEKALRGAIGATVTGLPAHLRDEPIEMVLYETLLGGFFGYNARPSYEAEGGKFIQRSLYGSEKGRIFRPEGSKIWDTFHPKAKDYIVNQSTDMSKTWLSKNFDSEWVDQVVKKTVYDKAKDLKKVTQKDVDSEYRNLAHKLYKDAHPDALPKAPINDIREDAEEKIYQEELTDTVMYTDIVSMMKSIGNAINKHSPNTKASPSQIAKDINQRYKDSDTADTFIKRMKASTMGKAVDKKMEQRLRQFYHNRRKAPRKVIAMEVGENGSVETHIGNGNWNGKKVGMSMVDMPVHYTDPNGKHIALSHIKVKRGDSWQIVKPLSSSIESENFNLISKRGVTGDEYFHMEYDLSKKGLYVHGGKKDNTELWIRDYHPDGENIRPEDLINILVKGQGADKAEIIKDLQNSRELEYKWFGLDKKDNRRISVREMHDKAWVSNVLTMAERNGFHKTGEPVTSKISQLMDPAFGKNVVDFNKREQLLFDRSVPQEQSVYNDLLLDGKNLRYIILNDKDGSSATDGSVIMRQNLFDRGIKNMGLPDKSGMLKSIFLTKNNNGMMHVKNATRRANETWETFLKDNDVDVVFFSSAVKQAGYNKGVDYQYSKGKIGLKGDAKRELMPIKDFRINPSTYESDKLGFMGVPRQVSSILNDAQTPGMAERFFKEIIEPSLNGVKDFNVKYKSEKDILKALESDSQFVFKMPLDLIHKILKTDSKLSRKIRRQIIKMDEEGQLFEYGDSDFEGFHQRNLRLLDIADASFGVANFNKYGYKYWEPTYRRFIVSRYMQPKWKSSSKAVLIPNTPDMNGGKTLKKGEIILDNGQRDMPVDIKDFPTIKTLGQLWDVYSAKNVSPKVKKQLSEHLEIVTVRVPADSVSGIRVLRLKGFTGERGFGALTSPKDDVYLGGADKDIDSVFLFHGFSKQLKNAYKKHKNEWEGKEAKSKENEHLFVKGSKEELAQYKTVGSKFSPSMRKLVAESAVRGKDGLGFGLTARNTAMEWADIVARNGGEMTIPLIGKNGEYGSATIRLKKGGIEKLRELGREVVNYSADSADYPNMATPVEYRRILFDAAFEGSKRYTGKGSNKGFEPDGWDPRLTFADIQKSELGEVSSLIRIINPKGKDYATGKSHTINTLAEFLQSYKGKHSRNIHHYIASKMKADGLHKQFIDIKGLVDKGKINTPIDKKIAKLTGIKEVKWISEEQLNKNIEKGGEDPIDTARDFAFKNLYTKTSLDVISKQALDLSKDLVKHLDAKHISKYLDRIRDISMNIREQSLINKGSDFDTMVRSAKTDIAVGLKKIGIKDPAKAHQLLDMWLLSPINNIKNGVVQSKKVGKNWIAGQQVHAEPLESKAISDFSIKKMQTALNEAVKPAELPQPKIQPLKESPAKTDKIDRMAITPNDMVQTAEFKKNLNENPQWKKSFRDLFTEWTMQTEGIPRDETTISMKDIYALNNHFKKLRSYPDSPELKQSVWYNDLRTVDQKMKKHDQMIFSQYQTTVITKDGPVKRTVKRSFSTLGTMRNWLHKVFLQQDAMLESIDPTNDSIFKFRKDVNIKDAEMINDLVFKLRDLRRQGKDWNLILENPIYKKNKNRTFITDGKEYTLKDMIERVDADYTKEFKKFGEQWVWSADKNGKKVDWKKVDSERSGEVNEYLRYDKDGRLDVLHFLKKAVMPVEKGKPIPHIPLETILRFHYEYKMEKFFTNKNSMFKPSKKNRIDYSKGNLILKTKKGEVKLDTKWKPVGEIKANEYFPKRYGHDKASRNLISQHIETIVQKKYLDVLEKTGSKKEAERASELLKAKMQLMVERSTSESTGVESSVIEKLSARIDYEKLTPEQIASELGDVGANSRPDSTLDRVLDLDFGYDTSFRVIDRYKKQVIRSHYKLLGAAMANYRIDNMIKRQAFETDVNGNKVKYTKEQLKKLNEDGYRNHTDVWADYLRMYVRDAFGYQTTFPQRIIDSMGKNDSLKLKKNFYYLTSDQAVINGIETMNKKFLEKTGRNLPFLRNMPKGNSPEIKEARAEYYSRLLHKMGGLEARYQLMTLLAHTGVVTGNIYGGQTMNISSAGFRNVARAHSPNWIIKNVLKNNPIYLKRKDASGKAIKVTDKKTLYEWVAEQGAIDNFIKNEFEINDGLKKVKGVTRKNLNNFRKEVTSLLKKDPFMKDKTLWEVARKYGVQDVILKAGGSFMQLSERYLRTSSFLSHALQAREAFGKHGADIPLNDPYIIDMGLKGIENTQFLYHSAFRPAFMRTSLGKVLTRFKLFAFQSVRTRKEYYKMAKEMGFENDTEAMKRFKNLLTADLFTLALGSIYSYSLFDTALPPPWDWLKETSEWMFGNKREKERAFFGTYPYYIAPLQIINPPVARIPMSVFSTTLNGDWDRFMDYNVHTMYPFGRLIRSLDKTIYDKDAGTDIIKESPYGTTGGRFMKQFFRIPVDKMIGNYKKSKLEDKRIEYMNQLLEQE